MTLAQLNAKIEALPSPGASWKRLDRVEARHLRDERLGMLGCHEGQEPTPEQVAIVDAQLFPPAPQGTLL